MTLQQIPDKTYEYMYEKRKISVLVRQSCPFKVLKFLPRDFELTTNNCSYFFNSNILSNSSLTILHHIEENPNNLTYHLDIENGDDIIKKIEQIFQGEDVHFSEEEEELYKVISNKLGFKDKYNRSSNSKISLNLYYNNRIDLWSLISFFQNDIPELFVIQTKKAEYKCNNYGIFLSSVIREKLLKDPKIDHYFYDYDDEENEFELICNILNFKDTDINKDNANTILKICEELGIENLINFLTDFINENQKVEESIDNQQKIVDSINDLFDLLYHIKEKTVNLVAENIINSKWSKTEENVYELAVFIFQVIKSKHELHEYLIDLLMKLNENTTSKLNILLPYIINYLINYDSYNSSIFVFIHLLFKRNIISSEKVIHLLSNYYYGKLSQVSSFFSTEINEICNKRNVKIDDLLPEINVRKYEKFCEKNKNIDAIAIEIAFAIENDDIDTFQKLISSNIDLNLTKKVEQKLITPNIFKKNRDKDIIYPDVTYLNYSAAKGSIKCFKYLLLNNQKIDENTLNMAIIGGNSEIIRIAFNKNNDNHFPIKDAIIVSIKIHRHDIFDWIFEMEEQEDNLRELLFISAANGNIHALIQIIDRIDFTNSYRNEIFKLIAVAAENGFYLLNIFLFDFIKNEEIQYDYLQLQGIANTGNVSIVKLFEQFMSESDYVNSIKNSIKIGLMNIIEYISEIIQKKNIKLGSKASVQILSCYLKNDFNENLVHFIETINGILSINVMVFCQILNITYKSKNIKDYIKIADLIHEENNNNDFTDISFLFIKYDLKEMVNYFIDKKYQIYYEDLSEKIIENGLVDSILFPLLLNQMNSESKRLLMNYCDNFIPEENNYKKFQNKSLHLKKYLSIQGIDPNIYFDEDLIKEDMFESFIKNFGKDMEKQKWQLEKITKYLIYEDNNIDKIELKAKILDKIIKLNIIDPNLRVINNTILTFACQNNLIEIVKSLLLYDSIDVNLHIPKTGDTPLITSIKRYNNEITKLLINYSKIKLMPKIINMKQL